MSKFPNSSWTDKGGFTLLEIVISIGIFVVVASASAVIFNQAILAYYSSTARAYCVREASLAMDWIRQDIRTAVDIDSLSPQCLFNNTPPFNTDADEIIINRTTRIYYYRVGDTIQRREGLGGSNVLLAQNVTNLSFNYFNYSTGSVSSPVGDPDLRTIEITIVVSKNDQEFCLYSAERLTK